MNQRPRSEVLFLPAGLGIFVEGRTKLEADDEAWGWNVGALFQLGSDMRVGVSYRSAIDYTLEGDVSTTFNGTPVAAGSFPAEAEAKFPDSALLSVTQRFGDKWELLGDLQYTNWSTIDVIDVVDSSNGQTRDQLVLDFNDTWRVAFGVNYFYSAQWTRKDCFIRPTRRSAAASSAGRSRLTLPARGHLNMAQLAITSVH